MEAADMNKNDLTTGVIWRKLLRFFFPILIGTLFQQLYNTVDAVIVGQFVGTQALAAVGGSAAFIINLVVGLFVGLSSGATVMIAQYFGAGDRDALSKTVHTAIALCLMVGAVLTVVGWLGARWALELVKNTPDTMEESVTYLRIYFVGSIPLLIFNIGSGILRAVGDSKRPLYYLIVCCMLNIVLDVVFVTSFGMGVDGAAWATAISLTVSGALILLQLCRTGDIYKLYLRRIRIHGPSLKRILHIGVPAGIQSSMYSISNLAVLVPINELGTAMVAAWTASGKLDGIFWTVSSSFGVAISAFAGQCFGAAKYDRLRRSVRVCLGMAIGTAAVISTLLVVFAETCLPIFDSDPLVVGYGAEMLMYLCPFYIVWSFIEVISGALRGAGDAFRPMVITMVGVCALRVLWTVLVVPHWHTIMGICMCYPVTWTTTAVAFGIYYVRRRWLHRCIAMTGHGELYEDI